MKRKTARGVNPTLPTLQSERKALDAAKEAEERAALYRKDSAGHYEWSLISARWLRLAFPSRRRINPQAFKNALNNSPVAAIEGLVACTDWERILERSSADKGIMHALLAWSPLPGWQRYPGAYMRGYAFGAVMLARLRDVEVRCAVGI